MIALSPLLSSCLGCSAFMLLCTQEVLSQQPSEQVDRAWRRVVSSIPLDREDQGEYPVRKDFIHRLIGCIEGRLDVSAPPFWTRTLLDMTSTGGRHCIFRDPGGVYLHLGKPDIRVDIGSMMELTEEGFEFLLTDKRFGIGRLVSPETHVVCSHQNMDNVYVVVGDYGRASAPRIICFATNGEVRWEVDEGETRFSFVPGDFGDYNNIEIASNTNTVCVFGVGYSGAYVLGYSVSSGKLVFEFSTSGI